MASKDGKHDGKPGTFDPSEDQPNAGADAKQSPFGAYNVEDDVLFEVQEILASADVRLAWKREFIQRLALLSSDTYLRALGELWIKFGTSLQKHSLHKEVLKVRQAATIRKDPATNVTLPNVVTNNQYLPQMTNAALAALRAVNEPPVLFVRAAELVYVDIDERERPSIETVSSASLRGHLSRSANYVRQTADAILPSLPPSEVVEDIMALPPRQWSLPPLEVLTEVPMLLPDGSLLDTPGYDPRSRIFYTPAHGLKIAEIPPEPDNGEIEAAVAAIDEAVCDFRWTSPSCRANYFALLLTPIVRSAISGCVPMALIDAPGPGAGKGLLANLLSVIATGRPCAFQQWPIDENEQRKTIGSTLMAGRSLICFDNFNSVISSNALASALTSSEWDFRILQTSTNAIVANRATWFATGNNIRAGGDMLRRCYSVRIDTGELLSGRDFKHPNLLEWATENRGMLLWALLTMARAWFARGRENKTKRPLESFEQWHVMIEGILTIAGIEGFFGSMEQTLAEGDEVTCQWEVFLTQIREWDSDWFTVEALESAWRLSQSKGSLVTSEYKFTLPDSFAGKTRTEEDLRKALGYGFRKRKDLRVGSRRMYLELSDTKVNGLSKWRVGIG